MSHVVSENKSSCDILEWSVPIYEDLEMRIGIYKTW